MLSLNLVRTGLGQDGKYNMGILEGTELARSVYPTEAGNSQKLQYCIDANLKVAKK